MSGLYVFLVLGVIVGLSAWYNHVRKKVGANYVERKLKQLDTASYHVLSNVKLADEAGVIDHVVVSVYGVFLINRENYNGSIYGKETDQEWLVQVKKQQKPFANPMISIKKQKQQASIYLDISPKHVHEVIAFANTAILAIDESLMKKQSVVNYDQLPEAVHSWKTPQLSKEKVTAIIEKLQVK